jgi:hypothetical protein
VNCDVDGDGHLSNQPPCGGDDCNDNDARAHPGVTGWIQAVPDRPFPQWIPGDWNCDNRVDREFVGGFSCPLVNLLNVGQSCATQMGFSDGQPDCGVADGNFVTCSDPGLLGTVCTTHASVLQTQGCL